jgi:hypothetical protein
MELNRDDVKEECTSWGCDLAEVEKESSMRTRDGRRRGRVFLLLVKRLESAG